MLMDKEVQAVIIALVVVGSVFAAAMILRGNAGEPFDAIGLLNENCVIGEYPSQLTIGENVTLCIFVYNHMDKVEYYKVVYRIGTNETIPSNTTSSPEPMLMEWRFALDNDANTTFKVTVPFNPPEDYWSRDKVALIFELWRYNTSSGLWEYTGKWVHLYVKPVPPLIPGG